MTAPLITLFTVCKPFHGHIRVIQRNAIESWTHLRPHCEVILFGDEDGMAEAAADFGVRHEPEIGRNEFGTPLMRDLFTRAKAMTQSPYLCYINGDIMLTSDFVRSVQRVSPRRALVAGRRWNVDITERWEFDTPGWEDRLLRTVHETGKLYDVAAIDYFAFHRSMYDNIPEFALGRTAFDNWMIYGARAAARPVIDATEAITAIHQNHDYSHHPGGAHYLWNGEEAQRNRKLAGIDNWGDAFLFTMKDATHRMSGQGIRPILTQEAYQRHCVTAPVLYPSLRPWFRTVKELKGVRNGVMRRLGRLVAPRGK